MTGNTADTVLLQNRIPARVVGESRSWFQLAVLDDREEKVYGVEVSHSDLADLVLDWRAACGKRRVCRLQPVVGGLIVSSRTRPAA